MHFHIRLALIVWSTMAILLSGCGDSLKSSGDGPFGAPGESRLLAPFSGDWSIDFEKTLEAQKAAGVSDENIERLRKLYADNPQFGKMHPDMTIKGDEAVCAGVPAAEYRFFAMHEHDGRVCGKAWHHEDRFDPGDMSKCYVRLKLDDGLLRFEMRMKDGLPDLGDPDLRSTPPADLDSSANCDADAPSGHGCTDWSVFIFNRKP